MKKHKKSVFIILSLAVLITVILTALDQRLIIRQYTLNTGTADSIRIALITDLHSCKYGDSQKELSDAIDAQNPDVILFGGDICDDEIINDNPELLLKSVSAKYPCYYVTGNHEYWTGDINKILNMFRAYGVTVLAGTYDVFEKNGSKINICGVDDPCLSFYTDSLSSTGKQLEALKDVHKNGNYTLLLAHRPEEVNVYAKYDFDLILAGHAHGGQWRIPPFINGLYTPYEGWFPKYAGGKYTVQNKTMIVSRGLARETTRIPRVFNRPELVIIDLEK